jgi:hypothetical protein
MKLISARAIGGMKILSIKWLAPGKEDAPNS